MEKETNWTHRHIVCIQHSIQTQNKDNHLVCIKYKKSIRYVQHNSWRNYVFSEKTPMRCFVMSTRSISAAPVPVSLLPRIHQYIVRNSLSHSIRSPCFTNERWLWVSASSRLLPPPTARFILGHRSEIRQGQRLATDPYRVSNLLSIDNTCFGYFVDARQSWFANVWSARLVGGTGQTRAIPTNYRT